MSRIVVALILSVLFFFLFMFVGEASSHYLGDAGFAITFVLMAAYFFVCQFRLSHGNADALRKDWPIILALNVVPLVMFILVVINEKWPVVLLQGLIVFIAGWGGAFIGAAAASRDARKRRGAQSFHNSP
jgi:O-antigen/teichoic acid export membrane protein